MEHLPGSKISGLLNSTKNQIEIVLDGKKIKKLHFKDLIQEELLFPLYNIHKTEIIEKCSPGIYVEEKTIGFIASYEIKIDNFSIDDLQFNLMHLMTNNYCNSLLIKIKNSDLEKRKHYLFTKIVLRSYKE